MQYHLSGRQSSLFTRIPRIVAHELGIELVLMPIFDMTERSPEEYAGNPALKMPTLRRGGALVFGAENICRTLLDEAGAKLRFVWPEQLKTDLSRNAQELVGHSMAAQVGLTMGTIVGHLPPDNVYFVKMRAGLEGALEWLDRHLEGALSALPLERDLSFFEITLFCLIEHLSFRGTLAVEPYTALTHFTARFSERSSAQRTAYRFDTSPGA